MATIYVNAAWWCWWFGAAFGGRAFDAALLAVMAGQAFLFSRANPTGRRLLIGACGALIAWNVYVFVLFRTSSIPRGDPVTWGDMVRAAPRLFQQLAFE